MGHELHCWTVGLCSDCHTCAVSRAFATLGHDPGAILLDAAASQMVDNISLFRPQVGAAPDSSSCSWLLHLTIIAPHELCQCEPAQAGVSRCVMHAIACAPILCSSGLASRGGQGITSLVSRAPLFSLHTHPVPPADLNTSLMGTHVRLNTF